jgi:hypothetical protein
MTKPPEDQRSTALNSRHRCCGPDCPAGVRDVVVLESGSALAGMLRLMMYAKALGKQPLVVSTARGRQ